MRRLSVSLLLTTLFAGTAHADFTIPGFELVHTSPVETSLTNPDLREPVAVWRELFDGAKKEIVIAQFYAVSKPGTAFEKVLDSLTAAGQRGVKIRFLLDQKGVGLSEAATIARIKAIPNLDLRLIDFNKITGNGIVHAKYLAVDGEVAYIGSQNFDWRSFEHIHETGLRITEPAMVSQVQAIFEQDWQAQALTSQGSRATVLNSKVVPANYAQNAFLLASPNAYNPAGVGDSETCLPALLAQAQSEVRIQLLDYAPLSYGPDRTRPYYAVIDNAVRAAAARGVSIKLMVSNWNTDPLELPYLKSLAVLPNVEIKIVTLPEAKQGFIPYARVIHSKTMEIDGQVAWVGTSNWLGGYLDNSRNLEVVMRSEAMAERVGQLHQQLWDGPYARALSVTEEYPAPHPGQH